MKKKYRIKWFHVLLLILSCKLTFAQGNLFCKYEKNIDMSYSEIIKNINQKNVLGDSCTISFLDSLKSKYLVEGDSKYLDVINKISQYSDGYISEHIDDIIESIVIIKTDNFLNYLCSKESNLELGLGKFFFQILSKAKINSSYFIKIKQWSNSKNKKCTKECINKIKGIIESKMEEAPAKH